MTSSEKKYEKDKTCYYADGVNCLILNETDDTPLNCDGCAFKLTRDQFRIKQWKTTVRLLKVGKKSDIPLEQVRTDLKEHGQYTADMEAEYRQVKSKSDAELREYRLENGLCLICGEPVPETSQPHTTCVSCRKKLAAEKKAEQERLRKEQAKREPIKRDKHGDPVRCKGCEYRRNNLCQYMIQTGESRDLDIAHCDKYKKKKRGRQAEYSVDWLAGWNDIL